MKDSLNSFKYGTLMVIAWMWLSTILGWPWMWGILFLLWAISIVSSGDATVVEPVIRKENPIWFWFIVLSWLLISLVMFIPASWWGY